MPRYEIHSCEQMIELIQQLGFLPLLVSGIPGYSAEEMADEECRYVVFPDGGWDWPLWKWKGIIINESDCVYGKFFNGKAGFISRTWWPHFCNWRRSLYLMPESGSIEGIIYQTLWMATRLVTEDFVYPRDKHNREYGWGWSLLTTPERLYGKDACSVDCSPEESYRLMNDHLHAIIPHASDKQISKLLR